MSVTDTNKSADGTIRTGNTTQDLLADLEARGYKLWIADDDKLCISNDDLPITPVIWHAVQANVGKLQRLLKPPVTDSNVLGDTNVRKDNTDWSKVKDLTPKRGEERDRAIAEYCQTYQDAKRVVEAQAPENSIEAMMMVSMEAHKRRSARDREAERRIEAAKKGGLCAKCGRTLKDDERVCLSKHVYGGMWGVLTSHPGPRFENAPVCEGCAPKWMVDPNPYDEITIGEKTVRVPNMHNVLDTECLTCGRPVVHEPNRRGRGYVFCSYRCEYTYHNRRRSRREQHLREKVCEVCGKEFTAKRAHTKTCSPACKQKAYRERMKEDG